jgi:nucleoside-diphosphate-sugar epimerase
MNCKMTGDGSIFPRIASSRTTRLSNWVTLVENRVVAPPPGLWRRSTISRSMRDDRMRILVTGITGQVGGALVPRLAGKQVVIAANRDMLDLSRPTAIAGRLDALAPDLIVNPAAYKAVDRAEDEREFAFRINAEAPSAIARWAAARGVTLLHFSTDYVFDGSGERPWREDDDPQSL